LKHIASIFLIAILAFNWVGYQVVSAFMEHRSDLALEASIEHSDYDQSELVEMRVPLNAPYLMNMSGTFERCDGEIAIDGTDYKYVMRKVENGELVLLCLHNENKSRFRNSRMDFFKLVNDLNNTSQGKEKQGSSSIKIFTTVYQPEENSWGIKPLDHKLVLCDFPVDNSARSTGFADVPKQPPRA
jgi:hypothetical protein